MEVMSSAGRTDQMVAKTCWIPGWPRRYHSEGCWQEPQVEVIPLLKSPGQALSVQLEGSDLRENIQ